MYKLNRDMKKLVQVQIEKKLNNIKMFSESAKGVSSWIRYIRSAYGMSIRQLAKRVELSKTAVHRLEKNEATGAIKLSSLYKIAENLNCELVYALVPRTSLSEVLREQALKKAYAVLKVSHREMEMEDQAVNQNELKVQAEILAENLLSSKKLWD